MSVHLCVHSPASVICFDHRGNLTEEPRLGRFVGNDDKFIVLFATFVRKSDTGVLYGYPLHLRERQLPFKAEPIRPE